MRVLLRLCATRWQSVSMPRTTQELYDLLTLEPSSPSSFRGRHPQTLMQRTYGGQVLAQSLMAAYGTVPDDRVAHSLTAYFLQSGSTNEDIIYHVENVRDGRSFSIRRVIAAQSRGPIFSMSCSLHVSENGLDHADPMPRDVPDPEQCQTLSEVMHERYGRSPLWHEWDALDVRYVGDSVGQGQCNHEARMSTWLRTAAHVPSNPQLSQAVLAYASDLTLLSVSTIPHDVVFLSRSLQVTTIGHTMWFHRPADPGRWLLYDMISPSAASALGYSMGRLFQDGRLVASCAQEGLIRRVEDRPVLS